MTPDKINSALWEAIMPTAAKAGQMSDRTAFLSFRTATLRRGLPQLEDELDYPDLGLTLPTGEIVALAIGWRKILEFMFFSSVPYNTAIKRVSCALADKGAYDMARDESVTQVIRGQEALEYERNLLEDLSRQHDEMDANGWEISAHVDCAPDHEPHQGRQYSDRAFEQLQASLSRKFLEYNCRHYLTPIIIGVTRPSYTRAELRKMADDNRKGVVYDGKHYTLQEARSRKNELARRVARDERRLSSAKASGDGVLIALAQGQLTAQKSAYSAFYKFMGY